MRKFEILGTVDDHNACDCCGRTGLKKTVALMDRQTGEQVYFGTTCATKAFGWQASDIKRTAAAATADLINKFTVEVYMQPDYQQMQDEINEANRRGPGGHRPFLFWRQLNLQAAQNALTVFSPAEQKILLSAGGVLAGVSVKSLLTTEPAPVMI